MVNREDVNKWEEKAQKIVSEPVFLREGETANIVYGQYKEITEKVEGVAGKFETFTAKNIILDTLVGNRKGKIKVDEKTFVDIVNKFKAAGMPSTLNYQRPRR